MVYVKILVGDTMSNFIKRNKGVIITALITLFLTMAIFYKVGIFSGTILISDLNAEYQPLLLQLNRIFTGKMGLYNFNTGMGDNFLGTFFYYMSSPLNLLTIFTKDINLLVIILVTLKLMLSSIFSYLFFRYQFKEEKIIPLTIFSLLYTFSSFSISYYLHIMWLDIYMLFPLLLLGIDKIIKEKKHLIYIISLILIIFCNYYFAYMVCIFSFIYFNYKLIINKISKKKLLKENIHFIIVSILSCIGASIVLLPVASEIGTYSRQNGMLFGGEDISFSFNLVTILKNYILGNFSDVDLLNEKNFYIYTSIIVIPLVILYFINKKISIREKIFSLLMLILLILSISCNYLNYAWHGFVPPSFFNGRYTFMFILFILLISIKSIYNLKNIHYSSYLIIPTILFIIIFLLNLFIKNLNITSVDIIKLILLTAYSLTFIYFYEKKYIRIMLLILVIMELNINCNSYLLRYHFNVESENKVQENCINYIKNNEKDKFYRIDDNNTNTDNYSILYNYYSIDYFMSTVKKDLINFFIKLDIGNHSYTKNTISYDGNFYLVSSLLNVKYFIDTNDEQINNYQYLETIDNYKIYLNKYSLNTGYIVNNDILNTKLNSNGLENLNKIYKDMSGYDILEKINLNKIDDYNYSFKNNKKNDFYVLIKLKNWYSYSDLKVYINNEELTNNNNTFNFNVKNKYKDDDINISISANDSTLEDILGVYVYYVDNKKFSDSIDKLNESKLNITDIKRNKLVGNIDVQEDGVLFISIPYSNDLDIYVDGKKNEKLKLLDTFMGTKLDKGKHKIEIKYTPKVLYISIIPSILSILALFIYIKIYKKRISC